MRRLLSKSKYLTGLQCVKKLWLSVHDPERGAPPDPFREMILRRGTGVGEEARSRFSGGVLIEAPHHDIDGALEETEGRIREGHLTLFEPAFLYQGLFCRVDILRAREGSTGPAWDIIEVKSTLDVQELQLPDAAVQKYILEGAGYKIAGTFIMHLNRECRFPDLTNLFVLEKIDQLITEELETVPKASAFFLDTIESKKEPEVTIGDHCRDPYECQFIPYCWENLPSPSIYHIRRLSRGKRQELIDKNIFSVFDIPDSFPLTPNERKQIELYRGGKGDIDTKAVRKELASLTFPLYFLDFETDNPAIPRYEGTGPYGQIPFQYSLHILQRDGSLDHREYLHSDLSDPRRPLAEKLAADIRGLTRGGTVIAYYAVFEKNVMLSLGKLFPDLSTVLKEAANSLWDLLDIFKKYYRHPGFLGSNSLKSVLPVIVPELGYDSLEVTNGTEAQLAWNTLIDPETPDNEKREIEQALLEYCSLDTLAMVKIYDKLKAV